MAFLTPVGIMGPSLPSSSSCFAGQKHSCARSFRRPLACMSASGDDNTKKQPEKSSSAGKNMHISAEVANDAIRHAVASVDGDVNEMARLCAFGFVEAFVQCYKADTVPTVFVVCGTGFNGLVGLHAAQLMKRHGYETAVYAGDGSKFIDMKAFCAESEIELYDFIPSTLEFYYQVVVDALLGTGFDGGDIWPRHWQAYEMLVSTRLAIVSVDVPSGWDLKKGPRRIDVTANTFVKPEVLVSLGAPKECSKMFAGGFHILAGRHLPQNYFFDMGYTLPLYPGDNRHSVLISSNPLRFSGHNGEVYGGTGQYNATMYTKNPKLEWIDPDEDSELWDELD